MGRIDIIITLKLVVNEAEDYCVRLYIHPCICTYMHSCMHEYVICVKNRLVNKVNGLD